MDRSYGDDARWGRKASSPAHTSGPRTGHPLSGKSARPAPHLSTSPSVPEPQAPLRQALIEASLEPLARLAAAALAVDAVHIRLSTPDEQAQRRASFPEDRDRRSHEALTALWGQIARSGEPLILADLRGHEVAGRAPAIGEARIAACAGLPLVLADGTRVGSVCATAIQPHPWTDHELEVLRDLAACVTREVELGLRVQKAYFERLSAAAQTEELRALSLTDELTGLSNRRGFFALAEHEVSLARRSGTPLVLLFADVDNMKEINDAFGHATGDDALVDAAALLNATFRESDVLARVGGDEFAVLAWSDGKAAIPALLERLQRSLDLHNAREDRSYTLSLSVGAAESDPASSASLDGLLRRADAAMYEVKRSRQQGTGGPTLLLRNVG